MTREGGVRADPQKTDPISNPHPQPAAPLSWRSPGPSRAAGTWWASPGFPGTPALSREEDGEEGEKESSRTPTQPSNQVSARVSEGRRGEVVWPPRAVWPLTRNEGHHEYDGHDDDLPRPRPLLTLLVAVLL